MRRRGAQRVVVEISPQDYVGVILRGWKLNIPVFVGALVVAAVVSFWQPPTYEASITMFQPSYRVAGGLMIGSTDQAEKLQPGLPGSAALEVQEQGALKSTPSPVEKSPGYGPIVCPDVSREWTIRAVLLWYSL